MARVTQDDLLDAIREAMTPKAEGDGITGNELAKKLGIAPGRACNLIRDFLESGKAERVRIQRVGIDGRRIVINGYRLKPCP